MATPPLYKYYFTDSNGNYYVRDVNGNVGVISEKTPLPDSPNGWDTVKYSFLRNEKYHGVFRKMTAPLSFYGYAADILRYIVEKDGGYNFEAYCKFIIEKRTDNLPANAFEYIDDFSGEIDFSSVDDSTKKVNFDTISTIEPNKEPYFKVSIVERGLPELIEANSGTIYELPQDGDSIDTRFVGLKLAGNYRWLTGDLTGGGLITLVNALSSAAERYVFPLSAVTNEANSYFSDLLEIRSQTGTTSLRNDIIPVDEGYITTSFSFSGNYSGSAIIAYDANGAAGFFFTLMFIERSNTLTTSTTLYTSAILVSTGQVTIPISGTYSYKSGAEYYLQIVTSSSSGGSSSKIGIKSFDYTVDFLERLPDTTSWGYFYKDFFKKMVSKVSEGTGTSSSFYLSVKSASIQDQNYLYYNNLAGNTIVVGGKPLAGVTGVIKSSFDDMYQDMFSRWFLGIGTDGNEIFSERLTSFYNRDVETAVLGQVIEFKKTPAMDYVYNTMHVGYGTQDYDSANGRYEINQDRIYSLPIKRKKEEKNLISPYRADPYGIEKQRVLSQGKPTTDSAGDKEVFLVEVESAPIMGLYYLKHHGTNGNVLDSPSLYNNAMDGVRMAKRHIPWLRSILNIQDGINDYVKKATWQSGNKNNIAYTDINGIRINQDDDIMPASEPIGQSQRKMFIPVYYTFEYKPDYNLLSLIRNKPYGYIEFIDNNITYRGFVLDIEITSAQVDTYSFKLLGCPIN